MKRRYALQWAGVSFVYFACVPPSVAQAASPAPAPAQQSAKPANAAAAAPLRLTLQDALDRARKNSVQFQAAVTNAGLARQDSRQAFAALLPGVTYNNSAIYTQGAGPVATAATGVPAVFIANNSVHEYISQGNVHEAIDVAAAANFRRVSAGPGGGRAAGGDAPARWVGRAAEGVLRAG